MDIPWGRTSSVARQAAAADLWMELTGRKQAAAFSEAQEKLAARPETEKTAALSTQEGPSAIKPPSLGKATGIGTALGAAAGAGTGAALARKAGTSLGKTMVGAGTVGAGVGAAAGLGLGVRKLMKHVRREENQPKIASLSPLQKRLVGGAAGALTAGTGGGLFHYRQARPDASGKSKHERVQASELARLDALFDGQPKGTSKLKAKYHQLLLDHTQQAKQSPGKAALVGSVPYAIVGGLLGAHLGPRTM